MIAIAIVRGISAIVYGIEDQQRFSFLVQLEASISVIFVCPTAFRSYLLIRAMKNKPGVDYERHIQSEEHTGMRAMPLLPSIHVGATLNGMTTLVRDYGRTEVE